MPAIINADNGVASGSVGLKYASDNSGVLALQTNGNTAVTIDATGNIGVGTSSPAAGVRLDVLGGEIRAGRVDTSSEGGQVSFSRSTDNATAWYLDVYGNTSTPSFRVVDVGAGAVSLAVNSSGAVALRGGVSASGVGITFPSTQVASSDANTLDDYEEGTWTPAFSFTTTNGSLTYDSVYGRYTKIGNIVNATLYLGVLSKGTASGDCRITLPFTSSSTTANYQCSSCWIGSATGTSGSYMVYTAPNEALARFQYSNTGAQSNLTSSNVQNATGFMVNITYQVA